ncbi:MAG: CHAT domain-containing protein [Pseudomonadota bacterium]
MREAYRLTWAGRTVDAVDAVKTDYERATSADRRKLFSLGARTCLANLDADCASYFLERLDPANLQPGQPLAAATTGYAFALAAFLHEGSADRHLAEPMLRRGLPPGSLEAMNDGVPFVEVALAMSRQARLAGDFDAAREHLDNAIAGTLSLIDQPFEAPRLIVKAAWQLLGTYDAERAQRLVAAAEPLLRQIPGDSLLARQWLMLRATLAGYRKDFAAASRHYRDSLALLDRLQLRPGYKAFQESYTYSLLIGSELMRGDEQAVRELLASHPMAADRERILQRGAFADESEFNFALAEAFGRLLFGKPPDLAWIPLLSAPPRWTTDPDRIEEAESFGQAIAGLQLVAAGQKDAGNQAVLEAGRRHLALLQNRYRQSVYASPLLFWTNQIVLEAAVRAAAEQPRPDFAFILGAHAFISRSVDTAVDDVLANQARQATDEGKRNVQSLHTLENQRAAWEKDQLATLARRLAARTAARPEDLRREKFEILLAAGGYSDQHRRLRQAIARTAGETRLIANLADVQALLQPDEALIFYAPALDVFAKICVRGDSIASARFPLVEAKAADIQVLRLALTASHPASVQADSQYPAAAGVRLAKLLFGGLDDCLKRSRRLHHVAPSALLGQIPPGALLWEMPPAMANGYDLGKARWLIRDHAFIKTSSVRAFLASKRLSATKRATLDYLGVGDPVLAGGTATAALADRGVGSLYELPETAQEVRAVSALFDPPRARVLLRQSASEEGFRLQPLSEFDIVHFATHGLIREELPGLVEPSLVLTPGRSGSAPDDGLLTTSQIAALSLRTRLVVLSACNSARYEPSLIETGIQGLSTSFAIAGVPSMIAALWPVESALTRDFIIATFRAARADAEIPIADALAGAVRRHLDGPTPRPLLHPRFWAALVALGDGTVRLGAASNSAARDLVPFADTSHSPGGEIVATAALDGGFVDATIGGPKDGGIQASIRRLARDGAIRWTLRDPFLPGRTIAASARTVYATALGRSAQGGSMAGAVVGLSADDGHILWSRQLGRAGTDSLVMDVATTDGAAALALAGAPLADPTGAVFSLTRFDADGKIAATAEVPASPNDPGSRHTARLASAGKAGLAVINHHARLLKKPVGRDAFGLAKSCWGGDGAEIVPFEAATLAVGGRTHIDRFKAWQVLPLDGKWLLVGEGRNGCALETHAVAYLVEADGKVKEFWRDETASMTAARGVRRLVGGFEIIGHARRTTALRRPSLDPRANPAPEGETLASEELFSVRLSPTGQEQHRDFVAAGLPIDAVGMASSGLGSVIYGKVGPQPLWLER